MQEDIIEIIIPNYIININIELFDTNKFISLYFSLSQERKVIKVNLVNYISSYEKILVLEERIINTIKETITENLYEIFIKNVSDYHRKEWYLEYPEIQIDIEVLYA